jgi:hypothetical protein
MTSVGFVPVMVLSAATMELAASIAVYDGTLGGGEALRRVGLTPRRESD